MAANPFGAQPQVPQPQPGGMSLFHQGHTPLSQANPFFNGGSSQPQMPAGSLFGTQQQQQQTPGGGGVSTLFGQTAAVQPAAQGAGGGLFGAPAPGATTGGIFGGISQPQPAGAGLFGQTTGAIVPSSQPGALTGGGLFGAPQTPANALFGPPTSLAMPAAAPPQPAHQPSLAVSELVAQLDPKDARFRFRELFLNVVDDERARIRPDGIEESRWRDALASCGPTGDPRRLWPVAAGGFDDLTARLNEQVEAGRADDERVANLTNLSSRIAEKRTNDLIARMEAIKRTADDQARKLLRCRRLVAVLDGRYRAHGAAPLSESEKSLGSKLSHLASSGAPATLPGRVEKAARAVRVAVEQREAIKASSTSTAEYSLDEAALANARQALERQATALSAMAEVLRKAERDFGVYKKNNSYK